MIGWGKGEGGERMDGYLFAGGNVYLIRYRTHLMVMVMVS